MLFYALPDDGASVRSRLNLCYLALTFVVLMPYVSMGLYSSDKKFYLADASAKLYRPLCYYVAKVTCQQQQQQQLQQRSTSAEVQLMMLLLHWMVQLLELHL
jgi:hypothetical protein